MKHHIIRGGVIEYLIPHITKGGDWDGMQVQNIALPQHRDDDELTHVLVVPVPRGRLGEVQTKIELALRED